MKIRSVKFWNLIGIIVGIAIIVTGVLVMVNPAKSFSTESSESVTFAGDYYTYQHEATRIAGINAAAAANNLKEIAEMFALYAGILFIALGLLTTVKYAKRFFIEEDFMEEDFDYEEIMAKINEEFADEEAAEDGENLAGDDEAAENEAAETEETLTEEAVEEETTEIAEETIESENM